MEDQNIIIFPDEMKKLIEIGNTPKATDAIDTLIIQLEHHIRKKQGMEIVVKIVMNTILNVLVLNLPQKKSQLELT